MASSMFPVSAVRPRSIRSGSILKSSSHTGSHISQVEQQIANNNTNGGGSFIEEGAQQINVQSLGLYTNVQDIENTVVKSANGTAVRVKDIATVVQGPKIRLGQIGRATHRPDGTIVDNPDTVEGIVLLQKGDDSDPVLQGIHEEVKKLNNGILPKGVKIVPFLDRSDLVKFTVETVERNLTEGIILVSIILFLFLGNVRGAIIVALTIPFALLFAAICLDLIHIPANLLSLGALDFGMVVDGSVVMIENIVRHLGSGKRSAHPGTKDSRCRARGAAPGLLCPRHHHRVLSAHLHAAIGRRPSLQADGVDGHLCPDRGARLCHPRRSRDGRHRFQERRERVGEPADALADRPLSHRGPLGHSCTAI